MSLTIGFIRSLIYSCGMILYLSSCSSMPTHLTSQEHSGEIKIASVRTVAYEKWTDQTAKVQVIEHQLTHAAIKFFNSTTDDVEDTLPPTLTQLNLTPIKTRNNMD